MGSVDTSTNTASSEPSPNVVTAAIVDEPNDNDDLGDTSDEEPPFSLYASSFFFFFGYATLIDLWHHSASRGKVVCPTAGNNPRSGVRTSKQIRDAQSKDSNDLDKQPEKKKTK